MYKEQYGHSSMPPSMLLNSTIITPGSEKPCRFGLWPFRWTLSLEKFLQVDPFTLGLRQECRSRFRTEVTDDDTKE